MMHYKWLIAPAAALLGCGSVPAAASPAADYVAREFAADCYRPHAPTPAAARQLDRLCRCGIAGIRNSDIAFSDSEEVVTRKVHRVMETCSREENARHPDGP